jgi:hypothetical protein
LIAGGSLLAAAPAYADPGDASASGASATINFDLGGGVAVSTGGAVSTGDVSVTNPGDDSSTQADVSLVSGLLASVHLAAVDTAATSDDTGSSAASEIAGLDATLLGLNLVHVDTATAAATCPTGGTPTADAVVTGLTLLGDDATVTADDPSAEATVALTGALTGLNLTVTVTQRETTDPATGTADAIALDATATITGTLGPITIDIVAANLTLASAHCEASAVIPVTATGINPASGPTTGGQDVTITGSGFVQGLTGVTFAGAPAASVTVDPSGTSLTAVTPPGPEGPTSAVVSNPGSSAALDYRYVAPAITGFTPVQGPGAGGTEVTITGQGLQTTTGADFGGDPATILSVSPDGTSVVVVTPGGAGFVDVGLTLAGGSTLTAPGQYLYVTPASPMVDSIEPAAGPTAGGTTVTIGGNNLGGTTEVLFNGNPGTIVGTPTDGQVVVVTPPGVAGWADVTIVTPTQGAIIDDGFLYVAPPATTGLDPDHGPSAGGTTVTVDGGGFLPGATTVTICGVTIPAASVTVNADGTRLTFVTPACAAGTTTVTVTTPGGTSSPLAFRYTATSTAGSGGTGTLANTGFTTGPALIGAGALLAAGIAALIAMVVAGRRRLS